MSFSPSGTVINPVQETRKVKIEFVADEKVAKLIERAKELLRHKYPHGKLEDLVREAFEHLLEKKDPTRKINRDEVEQKISQSTTRHISGRVKSEVWQRDQGQCTFVSHEGRSCEAKGFLQLDHIRPWALGGKSTSENLRLLCATHNQWRAEETFGKEKVSNH